MAEYCSAVYTATWRLLFLSSGEMSLADKMLEAGQRIKAGQNVRLLDLPADGRVHGAFDDLHGFATGAAFADHVNRTAAQFYGTAGPAFVENFLAEGPAQVQEHMRHFEVVAADRLGLGDADGQVHRAIHRFALIAAAGESATRYGLTGWSEGTATDAALKMAQLWIAGRGGITATEAREAIDRVRAFVTAHGDSRFQPLVVTDAAHIRDRAGWRDEDHYWISRDTWRQEIHAGADSTRAARYIAEVGLLITDPGRDLTRKLPRTVPGRPRAYCVKADVMGGGDA